jgi:uncharacterized membrane protein YfcA
LELDIVALIVSAVAVFGAGIIRGYSGFGFAMVTVTSMSLVLPPAQVVPVVLILEIGASLQLVPQVWRDIDWYSLRWLLAGSLIATPFGVYVLATIPPTPMRIAISILVMAAAILLMKGWAWKRMPGTALITATGIFSGVLNGAAAIGGPPAILFYLSSPAGITVSRASIIAYFFGIDLMGLIMASVQGLVTTHTLWTALVCVVPLVLGITLGSRLFSRLDKKAFKQHVLILLIALSIAGMVRSLLF